MGKPAGLAKDQQRALGRLTKLPALRGFYLARCSAVAFHLGHRRSKRFFAERAGEAVRELLSPESRPDERRPSRARSRKR